MNDTDRLIELLNDVMPKKMLRISPTAAVVLLEEYNLPVNGSSFKVGDFVTPMNGKYRGCGEPCKVVTVFDRTCINIQHDGDPVALYNMLVARVVGDDDDNHIKVYPVHSDDFSAYEGPGRKEGKC